MPVKILLSRNFDHTHERIMFDEFCKKLYREYHQSADFYLCVGNLHVGGRELDALLVKKDAISVFEFKHYGGTLTFHENGEWPITTLQDGNANIVSVRGGANENPYQQVRNNKFSLLNALNLYANFQNTNLGHISGIVLFSKDIDFDPFSITPKIGSWFHITDLNHVIEKINQITSTGINLSNAEIRDFQRIFNLGADYELAIPQEFQEIIYQNAEELLDENIPEVNEELPIPEYHIVDKTIEQIVLESGFEIIFRDSLPEREQEIQNIANLGLCQGNQRYLNQAVGGNIYRHQFKALELLKPKNDGAFNNVCLATSTSSGKSLVFYTQAIEIISKSPNAKIIAIYPLKALGYQQEEKWNQAFQMSGMAISVGRIDGTIPSNQRNAILERSNVIVVTPDVIHSWFLSNLDKPRIKALFRNLALVIVDEVHVYRGVFGSNSAYLFRRINFACEQLKLNNADPVQYLCASATINNPHDFLLQLTGLDFSIVDQEFESSPKHKIDVMLLDSQESTEPYSRIADFINRISSDPNNRSITFVDNRKAVEQIATIADRFENNRIFPYRSGYESEDRNRIQDNLTNGTLNGVISTSALEMGIDIGHLNIGILFGVPSSQTSFMQRIGRIGRHQPGIVFIINDRSIRSERIFQNPQNIFNIPLADTALYLDNEFIQYIHALCMVGLNGAPEAQAVGRMNLEESSVTFPTGFVNLCERVKNSIEAPHLKSLNPNNNEIPQHTFPLRDIEKQFKIELTEGRDITPLGEMTKSQQMREAYPGAVYYHMMRPYRVTSIEHHKIRLRNEAHYSTRPILQIMPYPNIQDGLIEGKTFSDTTIIECNLDVYENIFGYYERRGGADEIAHNYPNNYFGRRTYSRRIVTTGVLIGQGPLSRISSPEKLEGIANIFFNVFLTNIPFESQDLNYCIGSFNALNTGGIFNAGDRYICIYDKTYGSLRLTSRLMFQEVLLGSINSALEWLETAEFVFTKDGEQVFIDEEIIGFFTSLKAEILEPETLLQRANDSQTGHQNQIVSVLSLNQKIKINNEDAEYTIDWVYPQVVNGVATMFYDLKDEQTGDPRPGIPQSSLAVNPNHQISQYDLTRSRIL